MRLIDPITGRTYVEKRRRRFNEHSEPRELTFGCYRGYPFLLRDRTREWFREALETARKKFGFQLLAYVIMPEHVHLLVLPPPSAPGKATRLTNVEDKQMSRFLQALKEPVARKAIAHLRRTSPQWLARVRVQEGNRIRHRFWQPGGGYDRNVLEARTVAHDDRLHTCQSRSTRLGREDRRLGMVQRTLVCRYWTRQDSHR